MNSIQYHSNTLQGLMLDTQNQVLLWMLHKAVSLLPRWSIRMALCHVYAKATQSVSILAPVYCKFRLYPNDKLHNLNWFAYWFAFFLDANEFFFVL